jgi:hypothetical protein
VTAAKTAPLTAAEASGAGQGAGPGAGVVGGLVILGLGLAGLSGAFLVTAGRRRRAGSTVGRSKIER